MPDAKLAAAVGALFDEREDLAIETRVPTVEAMSLLKGSEAGVVRRELDLLLANRDTPVDAGALARLAVFGSRNGEVPASAALGFATRAAEQAPEDLESATYLIVALAEVGEHADALEQLEATALAHPDWGSGATADSWRGSLAYNLGRFEAAVAAYGRAVAADRAAINYLRLGDSLRRREQKDAARDSYRKALRLEPDLDEALLGYLAMALPFDSPLAGAVERLLSSRPRLRLSSVLFGNSATRRLARLLLRFVHRRAPERIDIRLALGVVALLDLELDCAESLLVAFTKTSPVDSVGLGLATVVAIYSGRTTEAIARARQMRLASWGNKDDKDGAKFIARCFWRLRELQPKLARIDTRECYEAALNVWPHAGEAIISELRPADGRQPWTLSIALAAHAGALAAAGAFRVGDRRREEIELIVKGEAVGGPTREARIAVYGQAESIIVRWIEGDPIWIAGERLGPAFVRIPIVEPGAPGPPSDDILSVPRGVDIRDALAPLLHWV
jgi:tetratricopeptide (TPR) repeat protein